MQSATSRALCATVQVLPNRMHALAVLCFVALALLGIGLEVSSGWLVWPPVIYAPAAPERQRSAPRARDEADTQAAWWSVEHTWRQPFLQGLLLQLVWWAQGQVGPAWGVLAPWLA